MDRLLVIVALVVAPLVLAAGVSAERKPTAAEARAITRALVPPYKLPRKCGLPIIRVSTVDKRWARVDVRFVDPLPPACRKWLFDGSALLRRTTRGWKNVTFGSDIGSSDSCPSLLRQGIPRRVLQDLFPGSYC